MANTTWTQSAGMTSEEDTDNLESYSEQAEASKDAAAASEAAASASATAASASATAASASETAAETAETNAETAEINAATSAATATTKASEASTSASSASTSATAAQTAQTAAETAQTAAETAETNAETAETNAETAQAAAEAAQTAAETAETNAATSETNAATSETNAATSETDAATSASTATTKASEASTSATNAATSESNASTSEANAATSESNASASETAAAASETAAAASESAAETAKDAALAALDSFDDRYLGQKASAPAVDNDGDALVAGALYFNTTDDVMNVYEGSVWVAAYASLSGALLASNNLSDLTNTVAARSNLGLGTAATTASTDYATAAQGSTADSAVQPNDSPTFAGLTTTADVSFGDNDKAIFGAGSDLQIYHDGNNSVIRDAGTGNLRLQAGNFEVTNGDATQNIITGVVGGAVRVYHSNDEKIATTSTGVDVTGTVTADGLTVSGASGTLATLNRVGSNGVYLNLADNSGSNVFLGNSGGQFQVQTSGSSYANKMTVEANGDISFYEDTGTTPKFFWDASAESLGIGTSSPEEKLHVEGSLKVDFGSAGGNPRVYLDHDSATDDGNYLQLNRGDDGLEVVGQDNVKIRTSGAERMRINSSGIVDILGGTVELNGNTLSSIQVTIADDAVAELTFPNRRFGLLNLVEGANDDVFPDSNIYAIAYVDFGNSPNATSVQKGSDVDLNNASALTGTTGTDGKFTVGVGGTSGTLYLENREGNTRVVNVTLL